MAQLTAMKVLIIHWGNNGGGPKFSLEMAKGLSQVPNLELHVSYSEHSDQRLEWESLGIPSYVVRTYKTKKGLILGLPRMVVMALKLRRYIRDHDIQAVYSSMFSIWQSLSVPLYISKRILFFPSVHDAVDHPGENHWLKELCRAIELKYATAPIAYSRHVQSVLEKRLNGHKEVIHVPHGIGATSSQKKTLAMNRDLRIGFFGRLVEYKGIHLYIEAMRLLRSEGVRVRGVVRGNGPIDATTVRETSGFIDWKVGWIDEGEIGSILDGFDVLALPYIEASQSGVLSLGVGRGIPVVATPIGGLKDQVLETGGGILSDAVSASSFADAVRLIAGDAELYEYLSMAGLASATGNLSWKAVAERLAGRMAAHRRSMN